MLALRKNGGSMRALIAVFFLLYTVPFAPAGEVPIEGVYVFFATEQAPANPEASPASPESPPYPKDPDTGPIFREGPDEPQPDDGFDPPGPGQSGRPLFSLHGGFGGGMTPYWNVFVGANAGVTFGDGFLSAGVSGYGAMAPTLGADAYVRLMPVRITKKGGLFVVARVGVQDERLDHYGYYKTRAIGVGWMQKTGKGTWAVFEGGYLDRTCGSQEKLHLCDDDMGFVYLSASAEGHWALWRRE